MKKIIIKKCYRCHFNGINSIGEEICKYWDIPKKLEYENYENFPDWCPLEEGEDGKQADSLMPATDDYSEEELLKLALYLQTNYKGQLDQDKSPVDMAIKLLSNYEKQNRIIYKRLSKIEKRLDEMLMYISTQGRENETDTL